MEGSRKSQPRAVFRKFRGQRAEKARAVTGMGSYLGTQPAEEVRAAVAVM